MRQYSAGLMTWEPNRPHGSVEASDLPGHGTSLAFKPGANFELKSPRTGRVITMCYQDTIVEHQELVGWFFSGNVDGKTITVMVYND